jgi:hypothetical protein
VPAAALTPAPLGHQDGAGQQRRNRQPAPAEARGEGLRGLQVDAVAQPGVSFAA